MAILDMKKVTVAGLNHVRTPLIHELMHLGAIEINAQDGFVTDEDWSPDIYKPSNSADIARIDADITRVSIALEMMSQYSKDKPSMFRGKKAIPRAAFSGYMDKHKTEIEISIDKIVSAHSAIADGYNEINRLKALIVGLEPWVNYDIPLNVKGTEFAKVILGSISLSVDFNVLSKEVGRSVESVAIQKQGEDEHQQYLSVICDAEDETATYEALREFTFNPIQLNDYDGTAMQAIAGYKKEIKATEDNIKINETIITNLAPERENVEYLYDSLQMRKDRAQVVSNMLSTDSVFYFDGWFPAKLQGDIEDVLKEYEVYYEIENPADDEETPVVLQNGGFATPFESITNMYSLPGKNDIDPTPWLAPFYFLFFGLMLSDAAYGFILVIMSLYGLKKLNLEGGALKMAKMFFYCGWSTVFWGALFGGWFGNFPAVAAKTLFDAELGDLAIWFNPLEDPMKLLIFSLVFGCVHLFVGMAIRATILIKNGRAVDAVCDIFLWYLLFIGIGVMASTGSPIVVGVAVVGIILTGGRAKNGIVGKLFGGLGSLYGITGYLSDVLSYSRLLALGLATGVVAQVINTLGSLAGGGVVGAIVLLIALVFGTIFNVAINALGAFVHSCRLQYVELFGKIGYEGGGKAFAPFDRKTKYIRILKEEE